MSAADWMPLCSWPGGMRSNNKSAGRILPADGSRRQVDVALFQHRAAVGTILPFGLCALPTIGTGSLGGWRFGVSSISHERSNAKYDERNHANGYQPHESHANPPEGRVSPAAHHARPHHTVAAITPAAHHHTCSEQEQENDDTYNSNNQPIDIFHFRVSFYRVCPQCGQVRLATDLKTAAGLLPEIA